MARIWGKGGLFFVLSESVWSVLVVFVVLFCMCRRTESGEPGCAVAISDGKQCWYFVDGRAHVRVALREAANDTLYMSLILNILKRILPDTAITPDVRQHAYGWSDIVPSFGQHTRLDKEGSFRKRIRPDARLLRSLPTGRQARRDLCHLQSS